MKPWANCWHCSSRTSAWLFSAVGGEVAACGLGVRQDRFLGIFDLVVNPRQRRQGCGKAVVEALLAWGKEEGARTAYLQVTAENEPALKLYAGLGFREEYPYWYRVRQTG